MKLSKVLLCAIVSASAAGAYAQEIPPTASVKEGIIISATKNDIALEETSAQAVVITKEDIRKKGYGSLIDALR